MPTSMMVYLSDSSKLSRFGMWKEKNHRTERQNLNSYTVKVLPTSLYYIFQYMQRSVLAARHSERLISA